MYKTFIKTNYYIWIKWKLHLTKMKSENIKNHSKYE